MTEATTGANNAKTAKHTTSPLGVLNYEMPKFDLPKMEMPEALREMAEKGVAQAKENYEMIQAAAEEATDLLKSAYTTAANGSTDYNRKVIEIARTNAHAAFEYAYELLGVKSPSEFIELSTAHARKQFEAGPLLALSGHSARSQRCPVLGVKRISA
jgi:phasin